MNKSHCISYTVSIDNAELAETLLIAYGVEGFEERVLEDGSTEFIVYAEHDDTIWHTELAERLKAQCDARVAYTIQDSISWVDAWKDSCTPVTAGRFYIVPEWYSDTLPDNMHVIYITPRMAFGTGHHATTSLCLQAISSHYMTDELRQGVFVDIGTGSGILSIALAQLGMQGNAIDIDPIAIENAKENALYNDVAKSITFSVGDITILPQGQKYSVIVANILADTIYALASSLAGILKRGGICILSGILVIQMERILLRYAEEGFICIHRAEEGEWALCIVQLQHEMA